MYVDNLINFVVDEISAQELIANLGKRIRIEDKGVPKWFLGIKNNVDEKRIILSQERYVKNLFEKRNTQKNQTG